MVFSMYFQWYYQCLTDSSQYNMQMLQNKELFLRVAFLFVGLVVLAILTLLLKRTSVSSIILILNYFTTYFDTKLREFGQCSKILKFPSAIDCHTMNNMYLHSSNKPSSSSDNTTSNSANGTIEAGDNHGNASFVNDIDNDNAAESPLAGFNRNHHTPIQLCIIHVLTVVVNHPSYWENRIINDGINNVNNKVNDLSIPASLTLHSHSYLNDLNVYGVSNISGQFVSPPPSKLCCSIAKFSVDANGTTGDSRVNKAEKLGDLFIRYVIINKNCIVKWHLYICCNIHQNK